MNAAFVLHGVRVELAGPAAAVEPLAARLDALPRPGDREGAATVRLLIHEHGTPPEPPAGARVVGEPPGGRMLHDDGAGVLHVRYVPPLGDGTAGTGRAPLALAVDRAAGLAELWPAPDRGLADPRDLWALAHPLASVALVELLASRGLPSLHAAGLALPGDGGEPPATVLLAGASGCGKSTLTLALLAAGWQLMGDDTLFLAPDPRGAAPSLLAFPDALDLTDETVARFPEFAPALAPARPGWRKRQLPARVAARAGVVWRCEPALLVLPRIAGREASRVAPVGDAEALLELAPNVLLTDFADASRALAALAALVGAVQCLRLETGTDLAGAVALLAQVARQASAAALARA